MSTLQEFLNANPIDNLTDEVPVSDRLKDKDGNLYKFKIQVMSSEALGQYRKKAMKIDQKKKSVEVDTAKLSKDIVINHTLVPDFKDAESIRKMGCLNPEQYLNKVLLPGEIEELAERIQKLSGFNKDFNELVEEAKN